MTHGEQVKERILTVGVALWASERGISASRIASALEMTHGAVLYHFDGIDDLRNAVAERAVKDGNSRVVLQLIALAHPAVRDMPDDERMRHMRLAI